MNAMNGLPSGVAMQTPPAQEDGLATLFGALWRGKIALVAAAFIGGIAGLYLCLAVLDPRYRATATLVLEGGPNPVASISDFLPTLSGDQTVVNTELEVLRSTSLLDELVETMSLLDLPTFNPALRDPGLAERAIAAFSQVLHLPAAEPTALDIRNSTIDSVQAALTVRPVPESMVIEVAFETGDPGLSAALANTLVGLYLDNQLESKFEATQEATVWLADKVAELEVDLQASESAMNRFAANMEVISVETMDGLTAELFAVRDQIAAREAAIARGDGTARSRAMLSSLRQSEADLSAKIGQQTQDLVTLEQLQREAAADRQIYEYFLARLKETSVQEGIQRADARLLSEARIPSVPSAPKPVLGSLLGAVLLTSAAALLLILGELRTATFRTADALEEATGVSVLGQVPLIPGRKRQSVLAYMQARPASAQVEAIRNIRTSLQMSGGRSGPPRVILSTSSLPGEGKTTHSLALAQSFAGLDQRVLLIEADIRKQVFSSYFQPASDLSIAQVLSRGATLAEAVQRAGRHGFDILFGGDVPGNPADAFSGMAFADLIVAARRDYDLVIIDSPPCLLVPDARIIAPHADAVLYTVRWDRTRHKQVEQGLRSFAAICAPVTGLILGQVSPRGMRRYGYGQDYGTYGKSGYYSS